MKRLLVVYLGFLSFCANAQSKPLAKGQLVYNNNCLTCHQEDGGGVVGLNPPLSKTKWVLGDKKQLIGIVLKGLKEEIEIEGEFYQNPMPAQSHLSDQEVADVLTYIRSHFGNKASAVTLAEVKSVRNPIK